MNKYDKVFVVDVDMAAKVIDGDHDFIYGMIRNGEAIL